MDGDRRDKNRPIFGEKKYCLEMDIEFERGFGEVAATSVEDIVNGRNLNIIEVYTLPWMLLKFPSPQTKS